MALHPIQSAILDLAQRENLGDLSLREIGRRVGDDSPQKIKFHLAQLEKKGLISIDKVKGVVTRRMPGWASGLLDGTTAKLYNLPIYGLASCGPGGIVADQNLEGFLTISSALLKKKPRNSFFAVQAYGNSMNRASIEDTNIESGDYLIIDRDFNDPKDGDVVLAIVDDRAMIKKFVRDKEHQQVLLISQSTETYSPICLGYRDQLFVNGRVVQVIKNQHERQQV
jgi:repressor LexA